MMGGTVAWFGSLLGLIAFLKSVIPSETWAVLQSFTMRLFSWAYVYSQVEIHEFNGGHLNELFREAEVYIGSLTKISKGSNRSKTKRMVASRIKNTAKPRYLLANGEGLMDEYDGVKFWWVFFTQPRNHIFYSDEDNQESDAKRHYIISVTEKSSHLLSEYLDHVSNQAKMLQHEYKTRLLHTNAGSDKLKWRSVPLEHPATFESMAMDSSLKNKLISDLSTFMKDKEFYKNAGRAWKRGYLLYGPPGTGKSSLIAAMANFTGYDIYDLELTEVKSNADLRKLLMAISSKSIIVVEDIDCSVDFKNREGDDSSDDEYEKDAIVDNESPVQFRKPKKGNKMTLSGLLNFTDGLWSSCGNERIIVFTTNYVDKIDPALLRTGRMDLHIHMSYCTFDGMEVLAKNYLGLGEDEDGIREVLCDVKGLISSVEITPSDVAEIFIQHKGGEARVALERLCEELRKRKGN